MEKPDNNNRHNLFCKYVNPLMVPYATTQQTLFHVIVLELFFQETFSGIISFWPVTRIVFVFVFGQTLKPE